MSTPRPSRPWLSTSCTALFALSVLAGCGGGGGGGGSAAPTGQAPVNGEGSGSTGNTGGSGSTGDTGSGGSTGQTGTGTGTGTGSGSTGTDPSGSTGSTGTPATGGSTGTGTGTGGNTGNSGSNGNPGAGSVGTVTQSPAAPAGASLNSLNCTFQYTLTTPSAQSGADPLFARQWYLQNTGQSQGVVGEDIRASLAWSNFPSRGAGVKVAVIDDGLEVLHDDLVSNVLGGASHNYRKDAPYPGYPLPCSADNTHGTAVAGVIAARDGNGIGGMGVAPRASLVGFNAIATDEDADVLDALVRDPQTVGVYNNSWGSRDDGFLHPATTAYLNTIANGVRYGRNGLGSIYVFAAGNGGCYYQYSGSQGVYGIDPTPSDPYRCNSFTDNTNYDGWSNQPFLIAACAVTDTGVRPWFGERGANALVCGGSGSLPSAGTDEFEHFVTTTGVENRNRLDFTGTSAAAPQVSGVIALMLAERPELSFRDVRLILARSARQNAPTDPEWVSANGLNYNPKFGFGVVNADAAVRLARGWTSVGGLTSLVDCASKTSRPEAAIPDATRAGSVVTPGTPYTNAVAVSASDCPISRIEYVSVNFVSNHSYGGDLKVELVSPNGLVSELAGSRLCYSNPGPRYADAPTNFVTCRTGAAPSASLAAADQDYSAANGGWTFHSVRHIDEAPVGNWTLRVTDEQSGDTGVVNAWTLSISGR